MNRAQISVLKQSHQVRLRCFLQCQHCMTLETQIRLQLLCDLTNKPLEW
ncbi:hypothetical protein HanXRQr2_Chr15g0705511 [Helianthus annuus]|uniref:Uncharacterized protein n=1 Tax=Helianthus annuus TaxID=4232 RepID=A0A9K3E3T4_HELAN|nr:hypothetical protein HanXRQr2_Chr15g0705511 [Helianthus annuus]KAJ0832296.1 hypothetical protein HanPSC8_Chr15g0677151 [Helianthus annuus]